MVGSWGLGLLNPQILGEPRHVGALPTPLPERSRTCPTRSAAGARLVRREWRRLGLGARGRGSRRQNSQMASSAPFLHARSHRKPLQQPSVCSSGWGPHQRYPPAHHLHASTAGGPSAVVTCTPPAQACQKQVPCPSPMSQQPTAWKPVQPPPHPLAARALLLQGRTTAVLTTTATLPNPAQAGPRTHHAVYWT